MMIPSYKGKEENDEKCMFKSYYGIVSYREIQTSSKQFQKNVGGVLSAPQAAF